MIQAQRNTKPVKKTRKLNHDDLPILMRCRSDNDIVVLFVDEITGIRLFDYGSSCKGGKLEEWLPFNDGITWEIVPSSEQFSISNP